MQQLTQREADILEVVRTSIDGGIVPSVREICARLGIKSTSTVHRYLTSLQEKGYILREGNLNRSIRLPHSELTRVPVVGSVAAGRPIFAEEVIEDYLPVALRGDAKELFALRVRGDSMINVGIFDGDLIVVRRCDTARNGEIVVALVDDEATVKRFYKENGGYRLQPENDAMEPIYTDHVVVLGRVAALYREF